jgi:hypothetical protein
MNQHPYLRAYMAGIVVPTIVVLFGVTVFSIARYVYHWPVALERVMIFPMAVVPNLWGLWNMLFVGSHSRTHLSIGIHGAILPLILGPLGMLLTGALDFQIPGFSWSILPVLGIVALTGYYLVWKYVIHFFNALLGIA